MDVRQSPAWLAGPLNQKLANAFPMKMKIDGSTPQFE